MKMAIDVLILNTATVDFRREDFDFTDKLVGEGGLAKCRTEDMPDFSQEKLHEWIKSGFATVGGPGNAAPLMAKAGLKVAVAVELGKGDFDGLDAQGKFFFDTMTVAGVDMSPIWIHPTLPTGTAFIHQLKGGDRGGLAYFPNANNNFDFEKAKKTVEQLRPRIVYYMYSGISNRGDANGGRDLAEFMNWCRCCGIVTTFDSHTLAGNPAEIIKTGRSVEGYKLLDPVLPHADIFFTSSDEAAMMKNTLGSSDRSIGASEEQKIIHFLDFMAEKYFLEGTRLFGVTVKDGAFEKHMIDNDKTGKARKIRSRFMAGGVVDLVGAGDSFRAGLITYIAENTADFKSGKIDFEKAIQMGNLFASLYVKSPLNNRYEYFQPYGSMIQAINDGVDFSNFDELRDALIDKC